jgi:endonuclease YncB( thermonuclease family)
MIGIRAVFVSCLLAAAIIATAAHHRHARATTGTIYGRASVIDGDTIVINGIHIRLAAIDAPESDQSCNDAAGTPYHCGLVATSALKDAIAERPVTCTPLDIDRYGRTVARCSVAGADLGDIMVRWGLAIDYRRYDADGLYVSAEREARANKRGIWAGTFVPPETWRHRR